MLGAVKRAIEAKASKTNAQVQILADVQPAGGFIKLASVDVRFPSKSLGSGTSRNSSSALSDQVRSETSESLRLRGNGIQKTAKTEPTMHQQRTL